MGSIYNLNNDELKIVEGFLARATLENKSKLEKMVDGIMAGKGIPAYLDQDLYEVAIDALCKSVKKYDESKSKFETYLKGNIERAIITYKRDSLTKGKMPVELNGDGSEKKDENGYKIPVYPTSLNVQTCDGEHELEELIASNLSVEDEAGVEKIFYSFESEKVVEYFYSLTDKQQVVAFFIAEGFDKKEIMEGLNLSNKEYNERLAGMKLWSRTQILR